MKLRKSLAAKLVFVFLAVVMVLSIAPLVNFAPEAEAFTTFSKNWSTEYYYPSGTNFVKNIALCYYKSQSDARNAMIAIGNIVDKDLTAGTGGTYYVYMGFNTTTDPTAANACKGIRISHNGDGGIGEPDSCSQSGVTWWKCNTGANSTYAPQLHGDGAVDLNRGAGGDDMKVYATYDRAFGPAISSISANNTQRLNSAGWTDVQDFGGAYRDVNQGAGGEAIYLHYYTPCSTVDTNTLRSTYANGCNYSTNRSKYTAASIANLDSALTTAQTILNDVNDGYTTYTQTAINNATNAINNALGALQITVTLNATTSGGTCSTSTFDVTIGTGTSATATVSPYTATKSGWTFLGWSTSSGSETGSKTSVTVNFDNKTLYAIFSKTLTANYKLLDENAVLQSETKTATIFNSATNVNIPASALVNVDYLGRTYTKLGWRSDTSAQAAESAATYFNVTAESPVITRYAVYSSDVTLAYNANGGAGAPASQSATHYLNANTAITMNDPAVTVSSTVPTRAGYSFAGWNTAANGTGTSYASGSQYAAFDTTSGATITLYAQWTPNTYTVAFNNNTGSGTMPNLSMTYGTAKNLTSNTFTKTGYHFLGWSTSSTATTPTYTNTQSVNNLTTSQNGTVTFYAVWEINTYTVRFLDENSSVIKTENVNHGSNATPPADLTKAYTNNKHYTFNGWTGWQNITGNKDIQGSFTESDHTFIRSETTLPTCTTAGLDTYTCACGCSYTQVVNALNHNVVEIPAVAPTCTQTGLTAGSKCSRCGTIFTTQKTVTAIGHAYNGSIRCNNDGTHSYLCTNGCGTYGYAGVENKGKACVYDEGIVITASTCTIHGEKDFTCTECGYVDNRELPLDPNNHVATGTTGRIPPTCTTLGREEGVTCNACGAYLSGGGAISPLGHDFTGLIRDNADGTHSFKCTRCEVYGGTVACTYGAPVVTEASTCIKEGSRTFTCTVCGHVKTETIAINPGKHNARVNVNAVPATCTTDGYTAGVYCNDCKKFISGHVLITKLGHSFTGSARNNGDGTHSFACANGCGEYGFDGVINAYTGCTYNAGVVTTPATCIATGIKTYTCTKCGHTYTETIAINPDNHVNTHKTLSDPAVCERGGYTAGVYCDDCNKYISGHEMIAPTGHSFTGPAVYNDDGTHTFTCINCGQLENTYHPCEEDAGVITKVPTCSVVGEKTFTCTVCGHKRTEVVPVNSANHTHNRYSAKVNPTCTAVGYTAGYQCLDCGVWFSGHKEIAATGHNFTGVARDNNNGTHSFSCLNCGEYGPAEACTYEEIAYVPSTCKTAGSKTYQCTVCGNSYVVDLPLNPDNHVNTSPVAKVPATCTEDGYEAGIWCADCNKYIDGHELIPATGHNFSGAVRNNGDGTHSRLCVNGCGTYGATADHHYNVVNTPATCTEDGFNTYTCQLCGDSYVGDTVTALGHDWVAGTVVASTCTKQGYTVYTCSRCDEAKKDSFVAALGHNYTGEAVQRDSSTHYYRCVNGCGTCGCDGVEGKYQTCAFESSVTVAPKCEEWGTMTYTCPICANSYNEKINVLGHVWVTDRVVAATCEARGYTVYKCTREGCTATRSDNYTPALGHMFAGGTPVSNGDGTHSFRCIHEGCTAVGINTTLGSSVRCTYEYTYVDGNAATCTKAGMRTCTCSVCGDTYTENVPALGHTGGTASCDKLAVCTRCGLSYGELNPNVHTNTVNRVITPSTCIQRGIKGTYCAACDKLLGTSQISLNPANHVGGKTVVGHADASCTSDGYSGDIYCNDCGRKITTGVKLLASGHKYQKTVITAPTCLLDGSALYTCSNCGNSYTQTIPALGHDYSVREDISANTYRLHCSHAGCGEYLEYNEGDATGVAITPIGEAFHMDDNIELIATVYPVNAINKAVTWSSSDTAVATIDANGVITWVNPGTVTFTATTVDGGFKDSITVSVSYSSPEYRVFYDRSTEENVAVDGSVLVGSRVVSYAAGSKVMFSVTWDENTGDKRGVYINGVLTEADGDGYYTIEKLTADSTVIVVADSSKEVEEEPEDSIPDNLSFWEKIIAFFKKLMDVFLKAFSKG